MCSISCGIRAAEKRAGAGRLLLIPLWGMSWEDVR